MSKETMESINKQIADLKAKINNDKEALNALREKKQSLKESAKAETKK